MTSSKRLFWSVVSAVVAKVGAGVVVADRVTGQFPGMLLGVEVGAGGGKVEQFQEGMVRQQAVEGSAAMPGGAIQQQQDRLLRQAGEQVREEVSGHLGGLSG